LPLLAYSFWRVLPAWIGIGLLIFITQIAVCAIVHDNENVKVLLRFLDMLPSIVKAVLGGDALQAGNTASLIAIGYQHPFVLDLFMVYAVGVPVILLTAESQRGTMELILSRSVTKLQVYVCAAILSLTGMFMLVMVMFLGTAAGTWIYDFGEPIPLIGFFRFAVVGGLLAGAIGAVGLLCAAAFARVYSAVGVAIAFIAVNYFIMLIGSWWPRARFLAPYTLMYYTGGSQVFREWPVADMCVQAAAITVATVLGAIVWQRRDLPS
jgi:hypothetical protein